MSWIITGIQQYPAVIGEPFGGGYFAGYISHTADGNPTHALIVAPRETGATGTGYTLTDNLAFKTTNTTTAGASSDYDGVANTAAMVTAGINDHPAAKFCAELTIGGFTDWYLPATLELDIAYFNLKPTTTLNNTGFGANPYSVPTRNSNWTAGTPAQTTVSAFSMSSQAFLNALHWSSSESTSTSAFSRNFDAGTSSSLPKSTLLRLRAFRRIAL